MVPLNCAGVAGPREVCCLCLAVYSKSSCTDLLRLAVLGAMPRHGVPSCKCHSLSNDCLCGRCLSYCVRVRFCSKLWSVPI